MSWKQFKSNGAGVIVSFERPDGEPLTVHRKGYVIPALQSAVDDVRGYDDSYLVVAISTPQSILTDLRGRDPHPHTKSIDPPEARLLRRARRFTACHPRLLGTTRQAANERAYMDARDAGE